ncbi:hypothetical protein BVX98_04560 [bacterium F11]|nr:hypothetical protein BVX98_04560 [bacterium F11]
MSLTATQYKNIVRHHSRFYRRLVEMRPVNGRALEWMKENNKGYSNTTIEKFKIHQGVLQLFDKSAGTGPRGFVHSNPTIIIPVGPVNRCYQYLLPKKQRWFVTPGGYGAQWMGNLFNRELLVCEGEWDCLRLHNEGFDNAVTSTAGSMTWLPNWTPLFKAKKVWICYDRDPIGQRGAAKMARQIYPVAEKIFFIDLPLRGTPQSKDVSDYFKEGGDKDGFRRLIERARPYLPKLYRTGK